MHNHLFIAAFHVCLPEEGQTQDTSTCSHGSGKALSLGVPFPVSPAAGEKTPSPGWAIPQRFSAPHSQSLEPMRAGPVRVSNAIFSCYYTESLSVLNSPDWAENLPWAGCHQFSWAFKGRPDRTWTIFCFFCFWKSFSLVVC